MCTAYRGCRRHMVRRIFACVMGCMSSVACCMLQRCSAVAWPSSSTPSMSASSVETIELWCWSCLLDRTGASPSSSAACQSAVSMQSQPVCLNRTTLRRAMYTPWRTCSRRTGFALRCEACPVLTPTAGCVRSLAQTVPKSEAACVHRRACVLCRSAGAGSGKRAGRDRRRR